MDHFEIDEVLTFYAQTSNPSTGAAADADSVPAYRIYEMETGTPIVTGTMALLDSSNTDGLYSEQVTLSTASGFENGKTYGCRLSAAVSSVTGADLFSFRVGGTAAQITVMYGIVSSLTSGGNTFATPWQNGVLRIAQGDTYTDTNRTALTFNQDGGNWPLLSQYALSGTNGVFLKLTVKTDQTNRADWTGVVTNGATLTFSCSTTGSQPSQVVTCRPGTITAYLLPTSMAPGYQVFPYDLQVVALNGTNQATLVKGECDVTDVA